MLERVIERYLIKKVSESHGMCIKMESSSMSGLPDRLCVLPGNKVFFVELKAPGKKPRALQKIVISNLKDLGCKVYVADSKELVDKILEENLKC